MLELLKCDLSLTRRHAGLTSCASVEFEHDNGACEECVFLPLRLSWRWDVSKRRRPGSFDWRLTPGPSLLAPVRRLCRAFMPRRPGAVQCRRGGRLGLAQELTYRLYHCRRCRVQVSICAACDHGNIYCAGECSELARCESVHRAGARYQKTLRGARCHAERQRRYRARQAKVTHQRFSGDQSACNVSVGSVITAEPIDVEPRELSPRRFICDPQGRCAFCGTTLPAFARLHAWRWSG